MGGHHYLQEILFYRKYVLCGGLYCGAAGGYAGERLLASLKYTQDELLNVKIHLNTKNNG